MNDTSAGQPDQANGKVTAAQARAAIEVLLDAFQRFTDAGQWAVAPEHEHLATSVFGWWAWINRSSQLIVLGHNAGLGHETAPNARSVLEHTQRCRHDTVITTNHSRNQPDHQREPKRSACNQDTAVGTAAR